MKNFIVLMTMLFFVAHVKAAPFITTGADVAEAMNLTKKTIITKHNIAIVNPDEKQVSRVHIVAHEMNRCGGYFEHETLAEAMNTVNAMKRGTTAPIEYSVTNDQRIPILISEVKESTIKKTIEELSAFKNRYYNSKTGVDSVHFLKKKWESFIGGRTDITVQLYEHKNWKQPSLIGTIKGTSDEVVVIGGHLDSISGWFGGDNVAPGADDNASGTATVTEIFRVLATSGFKPTRTIQFMGYAAEEVGLKGSNEIAKSYKTSRKKVVAVLQLDMTNFKGSDKEIYLTTDYTNPELTAYIGTLIEKYLDVKYGTDKCGYACSDHASWHRNGFPVAFPFEAAKNDMNKKIHTPNDTIEQSNGTAEHAVHFAQLGVAFAIELSK